jgi:transketolase
LSAADLMAVLLRDHLRWDLEHPDAAGNDHLIFSKGHASPLLYAMLKAASVITDEELLSYRKFGSRLQGHPVPSVPWVDVATGSLGQGLPIGVGVALSGKYLERLAYRVWVLLGDSEMSEGSIWEAFDHARHYRLSNLIAILDMNRLGQRGETPLGWNAAAYAARARAFGWRAFEVDGHDMLAISKAYAAAATASDAPSLIVARTIKGKGVPALEDKDGWHGKALDEAQCTRAVRDLGGFRSIVVKPERPAPQAPAAALPSRPAVLPSYPKGSRVATRAAYGDALAAVGTARGDVVVLDGEVSNSTYSDKFAKLHPERFFEMFIAEQQMVAAAVGLSARGRTPFASTFAAFLARAYDFIRMAAVSRASIRLCGSHAGVSIGADGPSQMGLEDLAMMRAVHGSTVLYPCCANQTVQLVSAMADRRGITYLRTTREATDVLYDKTEAFPIGGSKVLRRSATRGDGEGEGRESVAIIAAGVTVHEALKAHRTLEGAGMSATVIDAYSVKPIDHATIREAVQASGGNAVVVEDHWAEGGLGDAVLECLGGLHPLTARVVRLAVRTMPTSGTPAELLHAAEIDADAIVSAVRRLFGDGDSQIFPRCYQCGEPATWRIAVGGEDEPLREEDACELHGRGHLKVAHIPIEHWQGVS